ncbi:MAG: hypothetical protein ABID71_09980 [Chloroflexota bacterium]
MKRKIAILLITLAVLAAGGYYGLDYEKQQKVQEKIAADTGKVAQEIVDTPELAGDLAPRLSAAQASLATMQTTYPGKPNSTLVINRILTLADEYKVKAIPLYTQDWTSEGYIVFRLHLSVKGEFAPLVAFVKALEKGMFGSPLAVEGLAVTSSMERAKGEIGVPGTTPVTASLEVAIYAKSGY